MVFYSIKKENRLLALTVSQGEAIGLIFALWAIVYFGRFL
jgi:hypothetical protein